MKLFDTHAHIGLIHNDPIEQIIIVQKAKQHNVEKILTVCNTLTDFIAVYDNLHTAKSVYFAVGISPTEITTRMINWEQDVFEYAQRPKVIAIGETGLDFYKKIDRNIQIDAFVRHIEIANELELPLIIHNREAGRAILDILYNETPQYGFVFHCYSENIEYAQTILDKFSNAYISFAGNVTYRSTEYLHEVAKHIPLNRMLIESESPFMVPAAHRKKRNKPEYLIETLKFLSHIRRINQADLAQQLYNNALELFPLSEK